LVSAIPAGDGNIEKPFLRCIHKNKLNFVALICLIFMFFYHFPSSHLTILYIILYFTPLGWGDGVGGGGEGGTSLNFAFENFKYISISTYK
jgi:hypothetical protein